MQNYLIFFYYVLQLLKYVLVKFSNDWNLFSFILDVWVQIWKFSDKFRALANSWKAVILWSLLICHNEHNAWHRVPSGLIWFSDRHLEEPNSDQLSVTDLVQLEKQIEDALIQLRSRKVNNSSYCSYSNLRLLLC